MLFDAAIRPSFVARLRLSPRLGRIFFKKQTSNQLDAQLVIAICDYLRMDEKNEISYHIKRSWQTFRQRNARSSALRRRKCTLGSGCFVKGVVSVGGYFYSSS